MKNLPEKPALQSSQSVGGSSSGLSADRWCMYRPSTALVSVPSVNLSGTSARGGTLFGRKTILGILKNIIYCRNNS